jgi:GSH-dependent disulfide-bond oxidoreductase
MIDLYYWPTPNGHKVTIMLEETGLPYRVVPVNIQAGEQFSESFLRIAPNNRMPALVDHDPPGGGEPISVFESGAILIYLGNKAEKFNGTGVREKIKIVEWLMWQMSGVGPMFGQAFHFTTYAPEKIDYAINRYTREVERLLGVLDDELGDREYVTGDYSIADMAIFPWVMPSARFGQDMVDFPNVQRWVDRLNARPAIRRAYDVIAASVTAPPPLTDEARKVIFRQGRVRKPWN